jgi:basic membrane lipoprotein Med (substrate-binding protein (PBP1-ABC) superfamily)
VAPQIAARAQAEHAAYVGTFADEEQFAPKATVGSVVIDFRAGYEQAVKTWLDGNFDPSIHTTGVADGTIKVTALHNALEGSEAEVDEVVEKLKSGDVDWPAGKCADAGSS